jgi:L-seryl-tRNA(Ser) seleniumtransferase
MGGPQAGVIHGRSAVIERLRGNPLLRAFRVDKMTLAALEATLRLYRSPGRAMRHIPALRMLSEPVEDVERRARAALDLLGSEVAPRVSVVSLSAVLGGGTTPGFELPSAGWTVSGPASDVDRSLRTHEPPVVGRIDEGRFVIDFRTILEGQEELVARAVESCALTGWETRE